jgi:hypothetical protein
MKPNLPVFLKLNNGTIKTSEAKKSRCRNKPPFVRLKSSGPNSAKIIDPVESNKKGSRSELNIRRPWPLARVCSVNSARAAPINKNGEKIAKNDESKFVNGNVRRLINTNGSTAIS